MAAVDVDARNKRPNRVSPVMAIVLVLLSEFAPIAKACAFFTHGAGKREWSMTSSFDIAVIGGGLIGVSTAFHVSERCKTALIEQESRPGYHSSGRSAAILLPSYGGPLARALTAASVEFLSEPPVGFSQYALTAPRGALFVANENQLSLLDHWGTPTAGQKTSARHLTVPEVLKLVPILKAERIAAAVLLPDVRDIDAAALLQGYIRAFKARGGSLFLDSTVRAISRTKGLWVIETPSATFRAKTIVNAAGAWADQIADLAHVGRQRLMPARRTMIAIEAPTGYDVRLWPLVSDVAETFYFKPDAGRLLVSPADRTPVVPHDVQPEELEVAVAVDRFEAATTLQIKRVTHRWAGLRTISPDEEPILGFDPVEPDFLWAAGFAGFGVQAASAAGRCGAALLTQQSLPADLVECGVDLGQLSPARLLCSHNRQPTCNRGD
jgi:D-arginine dehydrogenase